MRKFWGILLVLIGLAVAALSVDYALWQDAAVRTFIPVECHIDSTNVRRNSGKHTTYTPEITYHYTVNGQPYSSSRIFPISDDGTRDWAQGIIGAYKLDIFPDNHHTAYMNPGKPEEAILIRTYSFVPYAGTIGGLVAAAIGLGIITGWIGGGRTTMTAVPLDTSGAQLLLPTRSLREGFRQALFGWMAVSLAALPAMVHWVTRADHWNSFSIIVLAIEAIGIAWFTTLVWRRWSVARHMSDVRLRAMPVPVVRGQAFTVDIEADAFAPLRVSAIRCRAVCTEHYRERRGNKTQVGTRKHFERSQPLGVAQQVAAGQPLVASGEFFITSEEAPRTGESTKVYPYYTWDLKLEIDLEGAVDYRATFPLQVD